MAKKEIQLKQNESVGKSAKTQKLKSALIVCALASVLAVAAVLFFGELPFRADVTTQKLFTLSPATLETLDNLSGPVRIAAVYPDGNANPFVESLLETYARASNKIEIKLIDAERDPGLLVSYDLGNARTVTSGTIIVNGSGRVKLVYESEMFSYDTTGNQFFGERDITGAIRFVGLNVLPKVYFAVGHGERAIDDAYLQAANLLRTDAWDVEQLPLLQAERVPSDAAALVFANPVRDLDENEARLLLEYLSGGGSVLLLLDPAQSAQYADLPFFGAVASLFGLALDNNYVIEEDKSYYYAANKMYLIPRYAAHSITTPLAEEKKMVILPLARGIIQLPEISSDVKVEPLLYSSERSRARMDMSVAGDAAVSSDVLGPVPLAFAATKSPPDAGMRAARLIVAGDSDFAGSGNISAQANGSLFLNMLNWLQGGRLSALVPGKTINADTLMIRGSEFVRIAIIVIAVIPLLFFAAAFAVWLRNRSR